MSSKSELMDNKNEKFNFPGLEDKSKKSCPDNSHMMPDGNCMKDADMKKPTNKKEKKMEEPKIEVVKKLKLGKRKD